MDVTDLLITEEEKKKKAGATRKRSNAVWKRGVVPGGKAGAVPALIGMQQAAGNRATMAAIDSAKGVGAAGTSGSAKDLGASGGDTGKEVVKRVEQNAAKETAKKTGKETAKAAEKTAEKSQSASVSSDDATSGFTKLAPVLDAIAPSAGSAGSLDAEIKIPIKGGFVGIHVAATVSRVDEKAMHLGVEANVTGGATVLAAHAKAELGYYLEVQGGDARQALVILSWVLYRQLAESNAPREISQAWFRDKKKGQTAEQWDALVRKTLFSKESGNWAEIGAQAAVGAKGGLGPLKAAASAKLRVGRLYDAESVERREGAKSMTQRVTSTIGINRGAQASLGDRIVSVIGSVSLSAAVAGGALTVTVAVRQAKDKRAGSKGTKYELDTIQVDGTLHCVGMDQGASLLAGSEAVANLLMKVADGASSATEKAKSELTEEARQAGELVSDLANYADGLKAAASAVGRASINLIPGLSASGQIHVVGGLRSKKPFLTVLFEKLTALTLDVEVFSLKAVKTERLASVEYADGNWTAHVGKLAIPLHKKELPGVGGKTGTAASAPPGASAKKGS